MFRGVRPFLNASRFGLISALACIPAISQGPAAASNAKPDIPHYAPAPAFDTGAIDKSANPCDDFYKYACGNFASSHPIPADQTAVNQFFTLFNVNTERLQNILTKYADQTAGRTPNEQKIGDDYAACMNTDLIEQKGLAPAQSLLDQIDHVSKPGLAYFIGELQRYGVGVFFDYGEMQDFKDSSKQIAAAFQGGLGLPERDYYTRTGDKDKQLRDQYVQHVAKMLTLAGTPQDRAQQEAKDILSFETKLAEGSLTNTEMRDPAAIYHPETLTQFESQLGGVPFDKFLEAIHSPQVQSLNDATPKFFPVMIAAVKDTPIETLRAYMRYHLLTSYAGVLPKSFDDENFHFYGTELSGQPQQRDRWKRCSQTVDRQLGEALGQVYVQEYFAGDSKAKTLQMVHDIEAAMDRDIDTLHLDECRYEGQSQAKAARHHRQDRLPRALARLLQAGDLTHGRVRQSAACDRL